MSQEVGVEIPSWAGAGADAGSGSPPPTKLEKCRSYAEDVGLFLLFFFIFLPIFLLYAAGTWLICDKNVINEVFNDIPDGRPSPQNIYQKVKDGHKKAKKLDKLPTVIRIRLVIILITWLIVNLTVPCLKKKIVLHTELWKWSLLVVMVSCGYHVISIVTHVLLYLLCQTKKKKKNVVYFAKGMRRSINLLVLSGSVLLTWLLYYRTNRGIKKEPDTHVVRHVGSWSFATLAVAAVLWAIKNVLLLKWEADAVYNRFAGRIFSARSHIYFLGHICGWPMVIFKPKSKDTDVINPNTNEDYPPVCQPDEQTSAEAVSVDCMLEKPKEKSLTRERSASSHTDQKKDKETKDMEKKAKGILCIDKGIDKDASNATLQEIKKMARYFVNLSRESSREDDGTSDVSKQCRQILPNPDDPDDSDMDMEITCTDLGSAFELEEKDARILYSKLKDGISSHNNDNNDPIIFYKDFEKYMVKAHKKCLTLGHTLLDAREVVKVLNQVMTGILIAIVFIAWLLLTDIASTKIIVLIASPFLAATFVFGETCKKIFEGIIFSFVNHPFDVGDRCIIAGSKAELEVKRMSVLSTTFVVIGKKEEALYPNSALASMPIINLKGEPDPSDHIELTLDSKYSKDMLVILRKKIKNYFEDESSDKYEKAPTIIIKDIGDSVKMEIQYEHVMSIHETTHSQCLRKKRKQKSELLLQLKQFIEETDRENGSIASTVIQEDT